MMPNNEKLLFAAALFAFTLLSYYPVFSNGFVYDDHFQLVGNPLIREFRHVPTLFASDVWHFRQSTPSNNYRPLHLLTYLIVYKLFGLNPFYFHALNFLLHLGCVFLLWKIAGYYLNEISAFLVALLFATHPVHVEPVAWIGGIPEVLHGALLMSAYLFFVSKRILSSFICFSAALFAKEPSLIFPAILLMDQLLFRRYQTRQFFILMAGCCIAITFYVALRIHAIGTFLQNERQLSLIEQVCTAGSFAGLYLHKILIPLNLKVFYSFSLPLSWQTGWTGWTILIFALLLVVLLRKNKTVLFGAVWFGMLLAPALFVTGVSPVLFAERYVYLPSAGLLLAVMTFPLKRVSTLLMCILALVFSLMSLQRARVWQTDLTLWTQAVLDSPRSATVTYNLATAHLQRKEWEAAARSYQQTVILEPWRAEAYYNLALCQHALGNRDEAIKNLGLFLRYWKGDDRLKKEALLKIQELKQDRKTISP